MKASIFMAVIVLFSATSEANVLSYTCNGVEQDKGNVDFTYTRDKWLGSTLHFTMVENADVGMVPVKTGTILTTDLNGKVAIDEKAVGQDCTPATEKLGEVENNGFPFQTLHFSFSCGAQDLFDFNGTCIRQE